MSKQAKMTTIRLTVFDQDLLRVLRERMHMPQAQIIRIALRRLAQEEIPDGKRKPPRTA